MKKSLFFTTLLAGLTLWPGCEKDDFDLARQDAQQPALQSSCQEGRIEIRDEDLILPLSIQMDVYLSYPADRGNAPGDGAVDLAISGTGLWLPVGDVTYFEVQYAPDPQGFWNGEGSMATMNGASPENLYFTSKPSVGGPTGCDLTGYVLSADLTFTHGTGEFRGAYGEALRKVFVSEDDFTKGVVLICGYVVLPGRAHVAPFEVEMVTQAH